MKPIQLLLGLLGGALGLLFLWAFNKYDVYLLVQIISLLGLLGYGFFWVIKKLVGFIKK